MRLSFGSLLVLPCLAVLLGGCPSDPARVCSPGASVACTGAGGCTGGQVCIADGSGYGACDCGGPADAGPTDAGPSVDTGGTDSAGTPDDAPAAGDAGPTSCDPVLQTGCGTGQRCVWRILADTPESIGELACVPDGTVAEGDPCTIGPVGAATGFDDCQGGLTCAGGTCATICELVDPESCGTTGACTRYAGLFANGDDDPIAGACVPTCDPVTQLRGDGSSCGPGQGCYWLQGATSTTFACAGAGSTAVGATITGSVYANSCVPGATAARRMDGTNYCTAFCRPVETHSGATAGAAGMSPHTCPDRGAASPPNECLFGWFLSSMDPPDPRLNMLGVCFDRTGRLYDSDGDTTPDAPWPSCTTLVNTDTDGDLVPQHREFGCAPAPLP